MYNLYDKNLRGNSIGCCPLYVSYSYTLLYTLKKLMYLRGNSIGTDDDDDDGRRRRRRRRTTHFKSFHLLVENYVPRFCLEEGGGFVVWGVPPQHVWIHLVLPSPSNTHQITLYHIRYGTRRPRTSRLHLRTADPHSLSGTHPPPRRASILHYRGTPRRR
jgi:hypothetical protein